VFKIYALQARRLVKETEDDKKNLIFDHLRLGRHFLERPDGVRYEDFVRYLEQENQKAVVKVRVAKGRVEAHGRPLNSKDARTAKKTPRELRLLNSCTLM
jgi:hypothetical protein